MEGDARRQELLNIISKAKRPISGTALAKMLDVSRQIIVQDIALLRAVNKNIISTNKGYVIYSDRQNLLKRSFRVCHSDKDMEDELNTIVDNGGNVLDVVVEHSIYGQIMVDLIIRSRRDVYEFGLKLMQSTDKPLNALTNGIHYHTVEADSEEILDAVENALREKGYLAE